jgi:tellurite resistance protein
VDIILSASQIAIVADERLEDSEETVLKDICPALGVDPTSY